jgi:predicted DNA-binding helix-hairpin-helix protein
VGADAANDIAVLNTSHTLYASYRLKRVYYSAFSPIPDASTILPLQPPPLMREHRLYQADWLLRFYGFDVAEISSGAQKGMLDLEVDPKTAWALANRAHFPVDINKAPREMLLRIPGFGIRTVDRILAIRRLHALRLADLARLCRSVKAVLPFICCADWRPARLADALDLRHRFARPARQFALL